VKTTKRQTRAAYGCLIAGQSLWAQAQPVAYRLYARSVCDTKMPLQQKKPLDKQYNCQCIHMLQKEITALQVTGHVYGTKHKNRINRY